MARATLAAVIGIAGVTSSARADGPARTHGLIEVRAGLAVAMDRYSLADTDTATRFGPAFHGDVGYRVLQDLSAGIHVGLTRNWDTEEEYRPPCGYYTFRMQYTSIQIGINATYTISDRAWLSPWAGVDLRDRSDRDGGTGSSARQFAFGLSAGADFWKPTEDLHRVGVYVDVARGSNELTYAFAESLVETDLYVSAGVAYRYR